MSEEERLELPFTSRDGAAAPSWFMVSGPLSQRLDGKLARVTCLMAIAIHFDQLISECNRRLLRNRTLGERVESSGDADTESAVAGT